MLSTTSRRFQGARPSEARRCLRAGISRPTTAARLGATQQTRHFHFGLWSSIYEYDSLRSPRPRGRVVRYRYMESITRRLSWDNNSKPDGSKLVSASDSKELNAQSHEPWAKSPPSTRQSSIADELREDILESLFPSESRQAERNQDGPSSPLQHIRNRLEQNRSSGEAADSIIDDGSDVIDPITNRRVPRAASQRPTRAKTAKSSFTPKFEDLDKDGPITGGGVAHLEQDKPKDFQDLGKYSAVRWNEPDGLSKPTSEENSKTYDDLDKYNQVKWNEPDGLPRLAPEETTKIHNDLDKYGAIRWNEPNGLQRLTQEEKSKIYSDLEKYGTIQWNEPDGLPKPTSEELSKEYDDLGQYKEVRWNEPDGLPQPTVEEKTKEYDDLDKYGAVRWNEPDGLQEPTPEERSKIYDDLDQYRAVRWNEPDGLRVLTPEELSKNYEDLDKYGKPWVAKDSAISAHELSQMDNTQRGEPLPPKDDSLYPADPGEEYNDLGEYGPVRWNEPDGLKKLTPEELSKAYDDLHLYDAVKWNEPDGLPALTPEQKSKLYKDLPGYLNKDHSEPEITPLRIHPEEASKKYQDLEKYAAFENGDPTEARVHPEEASKQYKDLHKYDRFENADPETERIHPEEASKHYQDLSKYRGYEYSKSARRMDLKELTRKGQDVDQDKSPNSGRGELSSSSGASNAAQPSKRRNKFSADLCKSPVDILDSLTAAEVRANVLRKAWIASQQSDQSETAQDDTFSSTINDSGKTSVKASGSHEGPLVGNFVRDFPEEFTRSWSVENSHSKASLYPKDAVGAAKSQETPPIHGTHDEVEASSMDESFPAETTRLEPALDRVSNRQAVKHQSAFLMSSQEQPQMMRIGLDAVGKEAPQWPVVAKHYTARVPQDHEIDDGTTVRTTQYKTLVYDHGTDTIAEISASSSAMDKTPPLSHAKRVTLTHPSTSTSSPKLFLRFKSLRADGYELIAGDGNILVFRKVSPVTINRINPIDMMGSPVAGNFASPTGFVNYDADLPREGVSAEKPEPPFRSNIDVRREEPVYSGGRKEKKKKRGLGRKVLVGSAWLVGGAYAAGVLGEYWSTGGMDGLGPGRL